MDKKLILIRLYNKESCAIGEPFPGTSKILSCFAYQGKRKKKKKEQKRKKVFT